MAAGGALPVDVISHSDWSHSHHGLDIREPFHFFSVCGSIQHSCKLKRRTRYVLT